MPQNIFVFAEIFTKLVFFQSNFQVMIPSIWTISGYCFQVMIFKNWKCPVSLPTCKLPSIFSFGQFPSIVTQRLQIGKFPDIVTRTLTNFRVMILRNWSISEYSRNCQTKVKLQPPSNNIQRLTISRYCYPEILQPPGNEIRRCNNIRGIV